MQKIFILFVSLIAVVLCQQQGGSLDDLINSVFNQNQTVIGGLPLDPNLTELTGGSRGGPTIETGGQVGPTDISVPVIPVNNGNREPIPDKPQPTKDHESNPCEVGECVPYYQCANGSIITDGDGLLDIRFGEENQQNDKHPCTGLFETCCTLRSAKPIIPGDRKINTGCGIRNKNGVGFRITGDNDNEAQFGEFPWTVAVLKEEPALNEQSLNVFVCGGSLIDPSVVITAAHCVSEKDPRTLKIRAGEWDTQTKDEIFPHQDRQVRDYAIHQEYYKGGLFNDIALLFLEHPVEVAEHINLVCLPPPNTIFDGNRCFASGWGKDLFGKEGKYQVILKRVELPVVPREQCIKQLRSTRLGRYFELHQSFMCAGGERGRDTCKGDGGSPLVCPALNAPGQYYQAGIVAWGIGCGDSTPGVYVNVALFRNWIDEQMKLNHLTVQSYVL